MDPRSEGDLRNRLVELLALNLRDFQLKRRGLPASVRSRKRARAPGAATVHLRDVRKLPEGVLVAKRDEDDTVMGERGDRVRDGRLLATTWGSGGDEDAGVLAVERAARPELAGRIDEGLDVVAESKDRK